MNTAKTPSVATRLFSLAAAVLTTAVIAGSQFGLGQHYSDLAFTSQAGATMAASQQPSVAKAPVRTAQPG